MAAMGAVAFRVRAADLVGQANDAQLNWMMREMKARWSYLDTVAASSFRVGETVKFPSKHMGAIHGVVTKVNRKTVRIRTQSGVNWKVSSHMLEHSDGSE